MEPSVTFYGVVIKPGMVLCQSNFLNACPETYLCINNAGKEHAVVADYDDDFYETVHLTQVALGSKPVKGPHTVFIEKQGAFSPLDANINDNFIFKYTI